LPQEVREVSLALHTLVDTLEELDDEVITKRQWIRYFKTLNLALITIILMELYWILGLDGKNRSFGWNITKPPKFQKVWTNPF